jgi:transposase InsO family protein
LAAQGQQRGGKRIARLMCADGRRGLCARWFEPRTTQSDQNQPIAPNWLTPSLSRAGNSYDNAAMESFNATDKREAVGLAAARGQLRHTGRSRRRFLRLCGKIL